MTLLAIYFCDHPGCTERFTSATTDVPPHFHYDHGWVIRKDENGKSRDYCSAHKEGDTP